MKKLSFLLSLILIIVLITVTYIIFRKAIKYSKKIDIYKTELQATQDKLKITDDYLFRILPYYEKFVTNITFEDYSNARLAASENEKIKFCIVVPSYNNLEYIKQNLNSVFKQNYHNWRMIYIDDSSNDGMTEVAQEIKIASELSDNKFLLITNTERYRSSLRSFYHAAHNFCQDEEVMIQLDGDDLLADPNVLVELADIYSDDKVWVTYGSFINEAHKFIGGSAEFNDMEQKNFRSSAWRTSHLRTSYVWLFKRIKLEDLQYKGSFIKSAWDLAIMFPLLEMAGKKHTRVIKDVMYIYHNHSRNDGNMRNQEVQTMENYIRGLPKYQLIEPIN